MTHAASNSTDNRYRRRLPLRLRRRRLHQPKPGQGGGGAAASAQAEAQISDLTRVLDKHKDHATRLQSEFENFRRRTRKEMDDVRQTASGDVLKTLLPVLDNFGRALQSPANSLESFVEGVQMIHTHMLNLLKDAGLETVDAKGKPFDPNFHEAVAVDAEADEPDNTIVEVLQDGYLIKGKLLRPAMVKVARKG